MTTLHRRTTKVVWVWCVAYTALAASSARDRRRGEIRSHLWESDRVPVPAALVLIAAIRGMAADLGWALSTGVPRLARSFGTPTPYVVIAPAFPIQAWIVSAFSAGSAAHVAEGIGSVGGGAMLTAAGLAWMWQRLRD